MSNTQTTTEENERYNTLLLGIGKLINHGLEAHTYPATIASIDIKAIASIRHRITTTIGDTK